MPLKKLLNHIFEDQTVHVSIPGEVDPESSDGKRDQPLEQAETEALFQSVLQERRRDDRTSRAPIARSNPR